MSGKDSKKGWWSGRAFVSMSTLFLMLMVALTGFQMHWFKGREPFGLGHGQMKYMHFTLSWVLALVASWHLVLNWRPLTSYLVSRVRGARLRPEWVVALVLVMVTTWLGAVNTPARPAPGQGTGPAQMQAQGGPR